MLKVRCSLFAAAALAAVAPAIAGEITGNDTPIDIHGRSECAFSGQNDLDGDPRDPGFRTQSYGQNVRLTPLDPSNLDPNAPFFQPIPGWACNPNRGRDLHAEE